MEIKTGIIIGFGEVGRAHFEVLSKTYDGYLYYKDKEDMIFNCNGLPDTIRPISEGIDLMMIATQCDPDNMNIFYSMVDKYCDQFHPAHIDILTTTPCGAAEEVQRRTGIPTTKSTIRGMHGSIQGLSTFLYDIPKHIGGEGAEYVAKYYEFAGIPCRTHKKSRATELFHALNNSDYGIAIAKARENYDACRANAVSYMEWLEYKKSNNEGFIKAGYPDKVSPILTPPDNRIGGHCVVYSATTIPKSIRGPLMDFLANYNTRSNEPIKMDRN